jgi:hydrogenase maturation protein HypF
MDDTATAKRLRLLLRGQVQGVGFRPFIHRLATSLELRGWVNNSPLGVWVEVEGQNDGLFEFLRRLSLERPPASFIEGQEVVWLDPAGYKTFEIRPSDPAGEKLTLITPDLATCSECLAELLDPANRRYRYPFINCTHCGPRYSIIQAIPYDRCNTTMRAFTMCDACQAEYSDPSNRRFHAQPNACPECGPHLALWDAKGELLVTGDEPSLAESIEILHSGQILAVKGLGGFHLMVDASNGAAVRQLRLRKGREEKPFAMMVPSLKIARQFCQIEPGEESLLSSCAAPIVLLRRRQDVLGCLPLAAEVAPGNPNLGVMLAYAPLHHLLLAGFGGSLVATSGNVSDEPICIDEREAVRRLAGIADAFLVHNRPIARHVDDSVVRVMMDRELMLRRARGYAPMPIPLRAIAAEPRSNGTVLATGAHLKNTIALAKGDNVFLSQHIGDLETEPAQHAFGQTLADLPRLYDASPAVVAADLHPDYASTRVGHASAASARIPFVSVQHHVAHVLSCMAENDLSGPVLGVAWDGTGYGTDGTIWGGEFIHVTDLHWTRLAHWRQFRLPGGDQAIREPRRSALGVLHALFGPSVADLCDLQSLTELSQKDSSVLIKMAERGVNAPLTSSAGRLFDAVAAMLNLCRTVRYEGQAAMELEFLLGTAVGAAEPYDVSLNVSESAPWVLDWAGIIQGILSDQAIGVTPQVIAARFHESLAAGVVRVAEQAGCRRIVLTGGCFQNQQLTRRAADQLRAAGFQPYWHQRVPPNDGGIALGQAAAVRWGVSEIGR